MMRRRVVGTAVVTFVLALTAGSLAACGDSDEPEGGGNSGGAGAGLGLKEDGTLTIGSNMAYAPFEFLDPSTKEPTGFDIELGKAIAEELGVEPRFVDNPSFDALIPNLQDGQYDAVISAMTITDDRAKVVDFTDGYLKADQSLIVKKDSGIGSAADLASDAMIGVEKNTTSAAYAEENLGDKVKEIRTFDGTPQALQDLAVGRIQAVVTDTGAGAYAVENEYGGELTLVERFETPEELGIAVRKGNRKLVRAIDRALGTLQSNGTYDRIVEKWFGDLPES